MAPRTEQELLDCTIDLAMRMRWAVAHFRPARTAQGWRTAMQGHKGFPDLVLARSGIVLFRELKGYDARGRLGRLSSEQRDWGRQLDLDWSSTVCQTIEHRRGLLFDVWVPEDFDTLIVPMLTAKAQVPA